MANASNYFTFTASATTLSGVSITDVDQISGRISVNCNSPGGSLYIAVRTTGAYGVNDISSVKTGTAIFRKVFTPPTDGANSVLMTGLTVGTKHYVGAVHEYLTTNSTVTSSSFTTTTYPPSTISPYQTGNYPNQHHYRDVPVHLNLLYGWGGDSPLSIAINRLPSGLTMNSLGEVTGIPTSAENISGITTYVTNNSGTTQANAPFNWLIDVLDIVTPPPIDPPPGETTDALNRVNLFNLIKLYADRFDDEVETALPNLLRLAESRLNRMIRVREMSDVWTTPIVDEREYYVLPSDFGGMRNIQYKLDGCSPITPKYVNPEQGNRATSGSFYTILTNRLRVVPPLSGEGFIEIAYYRLLKPLVEDTDVTWLLTKHPDTYVCAMMAEVESFVKNDERVAMWIQKLDKAFDEITYRDQDERWSGNPLTIKGEDV